MSWNHPVATNLERQDNHHPQRSLFIGIVIALVLAVVVGTFVLMCPKKEPQVADNRLLPTARHADDHQPGKVAKTTSDKILPKSEKVETNTVQDSVLEAIAKVEKPSAENRPKPKIPFATCPSDQAIASVISLGPSMSIPDTPMASEEKMERDFEESLKHPIVIEEDDPPHVKELKEKIIAVREEIEERRKEGLSVKQILLEHKESVNENMNLRREAMKQFRQIRESEGDDAARSYLDRANKVLDKAGANKIDWPLSQAERRAIREAKEDDRVINVKDYETK